MKRGNTVDRTHASGFVLIAALILVLPIAVGVACLTLEMPSRDRSLLEDIARDCGATSVRASTSEEERLLFWAGRKSAFFFLQG